MRVIVSGKNINITDGLRSAVQKKLSKLERYFTPEIEAHAKLSVERNRQIIEVTIPFNGVVLRGEEGNEDMYASIDIVADKIERQIRKQKTRLERRKHDISSIRYEAIQPYEKREAVTYPDEEKDPQIVRTKRFAMKPMSKEEAVLQMELLGHSFFVYSNADDDSVNVVYKRKDGNYGLIEPEF